MAVYFYSAVRVATSLKRFTMTQLFYTLVSPARERPFVFTRDAQGCVSVRQCERLQYVLHGVHIYSLITWEFFRWYYGH